MSQTSELQVILDHTFLQRSGLVEVNRKNEFPESIRNNILIETEDSLSINFSNEILCNHLINNVEAHISKPIGEDLEMAIGYIDEYNEFLKQKFKHNSINAYDFMFDELKAHILCLFHEKHILDVIAFKGSISEDSDLFHYFNRWFYKFLSKCDISESVVLKVIEKDMSDEDNFYANSFLLDIAKNNYSLAERLFKIVSTPEYEFHFIKSQIIISIHNSEHMDLFSYAFDLVSLNEKNAIDTLSRINIRNKNDLNTCYNLIKEPTDELVPEKSYLTCRMLQNELIDDRLKSECFDLLNSFVKLNEESANQTVRNVELFLKSYEEEKFKLLGVYLGVTKNIKIVNSYFNEFKNPEYLFSFLVSYHKANGSRAINKIFRKAILHFWRANRNETERLLIDLFNPQYQLGLLPIEIISSDSSIAKSINILSLPEGFQKNAIDCINIAPHSFENLLPLLISLRKSEHESIVKYLQATLSLLAIEAYGHLMEWLESNISSEKKFLKPIKKEYKEYQKIIQRKEKVDDLNPRENERELMELYFTLEHEQKTIMIEEATNGSGSFGSMFKPITIVRGNSWKLDNHEDASPLSNISHFSWVDRRHLYDPIAYEFRLNEFDRPS